MKPQRTAWLILLFALISIVGHPFAYAEKNSGRYLISVIRAADPALLQNDPVADALERFGSLFYRGLGWTFATFSWGPELIEPVVTALYVAAKLAIMTALFALGWGLSRHLGMLGLLAAWCLQPKSSPLGGDTLWNASMTHATLAAAILVAALALLVRGRELGWWGLVSCAILVHPLDALHLTVVAAPALFLVGPAPNKQRLIGLGVFVSTCAGYLAFLAPPALSASEAAYFLDVKGAMGHVSPLGQPAWGWVKMASFAALAYAALSTDGGRDWRSRWMSLAILSGSVGALVLSTAAVFLRSETLSRFQPMRILSWTYFIVFLALIFVASQDLLKRRRRGVLLAAVLALSILDSLWALPLAYLALGALILERTSHWEILQGIRNRGLELGFGLVFLAMIAGWLFRPFAGLEFLDTPWPWISVAPLVLLSLRPANDHRAWIAVGLALAMAVAGHGVDVYGYQRARQDADWDRIGAWCRDNTAKDATFITPPMKGNFRTLSFRRTLTEDVSAIVWVDPAAYRDLRQRVVSMADASPTMGWDLGRLLPLAERLGADYILVDATDPVDAPSLHREGRFAVWSVSALTRSRAATVAR